MAIPYGHTQQRLSAPADGLSQWRPRDSGEQHPGQHVSMVAAPDDEHQTSLGANVTGSSVCGWRHTPSYGVTVLLQVHDTRYKNPQLSAEGFEHNSPHLNIQRQAGTSNVNILLTSFHRQNQPDRPVMHESWAPMLRVWENHNSSLDVYV